MTGRTGRGGFRHPGRVACTWLHPTLIANKRNVRCLARVEPKISDGEGVEQVDVAVIGAGIGGLCCAAMLARYGLQVAVIEAHTVPGGAAHHWSRSGFEFDSGAALFSGLVPASDGSVSANPLQSVLAAIGEELDVVDLDDRATCLVYPDGRQYRTQLGSADFTKVVAERMGADAAEQWHRFQGHLRELQTSAGAVQPLAVRLDGGVGVTAAVRRPLQFLQYVLGSAPITGKSFGDIMAQSVTDERVKALVNMVTEGTCSVPASEVNATYMIRAFTEMWGPDTKLQYPKGGSQAIVQALVRGIGKYGGHLMLSSPVDSVLIDSSSGRKCSGVRLTSGRELRTRLGVVSNASVWDTCKFVPESARLPEFNSYVGALEMNESMLHLHVGFEAREGEDLPMHTYFLESELTGSNGWPTIVVPSVPDPSLAPPGHHVLHATMTEPAEHWADLDRLSVDYSALKEERSQLLWNLVRQVVPDIDERVKVAFVGSPQSHARFLRRSRGTYGPRNLLNLTGALPQAVKPLHNMYCCGDSVFPGVGTPAVSASGMWVANTFVPVSQHWRILDAVGV